MDPILIEIETPHAAELRSRLTALGASWQLRPADPTLPSTTRVLTSAREALVSATLEAIRRDRGAVPTAELDRITAIGIAIGHRGDRIELAWLVSHGYEVQS